MCAYLCKNVQLLDLMNQFSLGPYPNRTLFAAQFQHIFYCQRIFLRLNLFFLQKWVNFV